MTIYYSGVSKVDRSFEIKIANTEETGRIFLSENVFKGHNSINLHAF